MQELTLSPAPLYASTPKASAKTKKAKKADGGANPEEQTNQPTNPDGGG